MEIMLINNKISNDNLIWIVIIILINNNYVNNNNKTFTRYNINDNPNNN